jgi:hypothetical protein
MRLRTHRRRARLSPLWVLCHEAYPDSTLKGLFLHVGARSIVWRYRLQRTQKGVRKMIFKSLGAWPGVAVEEARKAALIFAGAVAADKAPPSKRTAATFETAWATYLAYLEAKAKAKGKPARWHANATKLGDNLILPTWAKWTLIDMANSPEAVEEWHAKMTRKHGPVSANHAARLIRATYKRRAARDITLSLDRLPTSSVQWNKEEPSQHALASRDIAELIIANGPALREAQEKISVRVFELLRLTLGDHHDAPLAPSMPTAKKSKAAAPVRIV